MSNKPDLLGAFLDMLPDPALPTVPEKESPLDASDELDSLTGLALKRAREILEEPIDFENDKAMRLQVSTIQTVLNTQVRVDEGRLKRRKIDALPKLLELIQREEQKRALG
jgi:hypothetical protein